MPELFIDIFDGYVRWIFNPADGGFESSGSDPIQMHPSLDGFDIVAEATRQAFEAVNLFPTDYVVHTKDNR